MKRTFAAVLSALLLLGMTAGCGSKQENNGNEAGNSGSTAQEYPETIDLTVYMPIFNETAPETTVVGEKWTEMMNAHVSNQFGSNISVTWEEIPFADYLQKISVYLASGDWADIFTFCGSTTQQLYELGSTGMLVCLDDYADYTPNLVKYAAEGTNRQRIESPDGKLYGVPQLAIREFPGAQECFGIRFDVFDANNIPYPQTMEDVYNAAKQLKELYPDSYPVTGGGILNQMYGIYNTNYTIYFDGEKYAYGPTDGKLKEAVAYLSRLYTEGLLDPEYATLTDEAMHEKALNDKAFILPFVYLLHITDNINAASNGTVEWGFIPLPKVDDSSTPWYTRYSNQPHSLDPGYQIVINSQTKYPEVMASIVDYQMSDEMINLATWGVEGVTYTEVDGENQLVDEILNADNPQAKMAEYGLYASMACRPGIAFMPDCWDTYFDIFPKAPAWDGEEMINVNSWEFFTIINDKGLNEPRPVEPPVTLNEEETQLRVDNITPVDTFVTENIAKFIAGERDISEWDMFVEEISSYGDYQSIVDIYNQKAAEVE